MMNRTVHNKVQHEVNYLLTLVDESELNANLAPCPRRRCPGARRSGTRWGPP